MDDIIRSGGSGELEKSKFKCNLTSDVLLLDKLSRKESYFLYGSSKQNTKIT